jgi:hypothetical protein
MSGPAQRLRSALAGGCLVLWLVAPSAASASLHATFGAYLLGTDRTYSHRPATGDFNGDGNLDVVTADAGTGAWALSVLIGHGDGTFEPAAVYDAGVQSASVAVGDFDEDRLSDVVLPAFASGTVRVLFSNGDGTFDLEDIAMNTGTAMAVVGDFDGNGHADLAALGSDAMGAVVVTVRLGSGAGVFGAALSYPVGSNSIGMLEVGDFDGNGRDDVLAVGSGGDANVLLSTTGGALAPATHLVTGVGLNGVAVGRFDGDARSDVALTQAFASTVLIALANADGSLAAPTPITVGGPGGTPAVGDANGDGRQDVAVAAYSGGVTILFGAGDGTFPRQQVLTSAITFVGAFGFDANRDGFGDLGLVYSPGLLVAINSPWIVGSPEALSFGAVAQGNGTGAQTVTVTNDGEPPLSIAAVALRGTNPGDFGIVADGCSGQRLPPGSACAVAVASTPSAAGRRAADLVVESNAGQGAKTIPLTVDGIATAGSGTSALSAPDHASPRVGIVLARQSLRSAIARGYRATVGCSEACALRIRLLLDRAGARRLRLASAVVGTVSARLAGAGTKHVVVKLSRRVRSRLRTQRRIKLTLEVMATDASHNAATSRRTVVLAR